MNLRARSVLGASALAFLLLALAACDSAEPPPAPPPPPPPPPALPAKVCAATPEPAWQRYLGAMHGHTSYSDGDIHAKPGDAWAQARARGLDYLALSDHSDTLANTMFLSVGSDCLSLSGLLTCLLPTGLDELMKWPATGQQQQAASDGAFLAIRGYEWTDDRYGHINIYFSQNFANAKTDLDSYEAFVAWLARAPDQPGRGGTPTTPVPYGGGGDGLAHFNHPSDKCRSADDPACNWNGFAYRPELDAQLFGIEVFNTGGGDRYWPDYVRALDAGWHVAAIGAEDEHGSDWAAPGQTKTVTLAGGLDAESFREAWSARRVYAVVSGERALQLDFRADGQSQGSRLRCPPGAEVPLELEVRAWSGEPFVAQLELYSNGGERLLATTGDRLRAAVAVPADAERWVFARVLDAEGQALAYSAPVWLRAATADEGP